MPLALGLSSLSNADLSVLDVLNKYSHDNDTDVASNAIFALGLVGAGTNNARLATMLRQLACYHAKNPMHLFLVRISQGLVHLGKVRIQTNNFYIMAFTRSLLLAWQRYVNNKNNIHFNNR